MANPWQHIHDGPAARVPDFRHERALLDAGVRFVAGVDEVGRGPLAGPVAAAAVILDAHSIPHGLDDSKRLGGAMRESLFELVMAQAVAVGVALVPPAVIDRINIREASLLAMRRAVSALAIPPDVVLVDGADVPPHLRCTAHAIIGGDGISLSIAAASVVAKVMRDRLMIRLGSTHPVYAFEIHKGYGTARHLAAIRTHGGGEHHRRSFSPFKNGTP